MWTIFQSFHWEVLIYRLPLVKMWRAVFWYFLCLTGEGCVLPSNAFSTLIPGDFIFFPSYATYYFSYFEEYFVISCFLHVSSWWGLGTSCSLKELKDYVGFLRGHRLLVICETEPRERGERSSETLQVTLLFCSPSSYTSSEFIYSF